MSGLDVTKNRQARRTSLQDFERISKDPGLIYRFPYGFGRLSSSVRKSPLLVIFETTLL